MQNEYIKSNTLTQIRKYTVLAFLTLFYVIKNVVVEVENSTTQNIYDIWLILSDFCIKLFEFLAKSNKWNKIRLYVRLIKLKCKNNLFNKNTLTTIIWLVLEDDWVFYYFNNIVYIYHIYRLAGVEYKYTLNTKIYPIWTLLILTEHCTKENALARNTKLHVQWIVPKQSKKYGPPNLTSMGKNCSTIDS